MPNRIIKESICTSEQIDELSQGAEILFYRLMVNADDFGLFDARLKLIASKCFPLKSIDSKRLQSDIAELCSVGLVSLYEVEGRTYGQIVSWEKHQQIRAKRAKFPLPTSDSASTCNQLISDAGDGNHLQANAPVIQSNPIQSESESKPKESRTALPTPEGVSDFVWADFKKLRQAKKAPITQTAIDGIAREAAKAGLPLGDALKVCCERGWTGFKADWVATVTQQRGPALPNQTVPAKQEPDPALEKIKADQAIVKPPSPEMLAKLQLLKRGGLAGIRAA